MKIIILLALFLLGCATTEERCKERWILTMESTCSGLLGKEYFQCKLEEYKKFIIEYPECRGNK